MFQNFWRLDGNAIVVNQLLLRNVFCFTGGFFFIFLLSVPYS